MKRHPTLQDLSRDHHHGLVQARRLKQAKGKAAAGVAQLFLDFWQRALVPHFRAEEEIVLPFYARHVAADHEDILHTCADHVKVRRAALDLPALIKSGAGVQELLNETGRTLEEHIRFEERTLFPHVEAALTEEEMEEMRRKFEVAAS